MRTSVRGKRRDRTRPFFSHAIARGNLLAAESAARELGGLALEDALDLCVLLSEQDPQRYRRDGRPLARPAPRRARGRA
jgi:hypothetical protein